MSTVFVSHPRDKLDAYFGAKATAALQAIADVRFNPEPRELSLAELIAAARGCDALIAYRQTAGPEALFRELPELAAFIRCAVDIRTVDVAAASAHGVLVTQASPGYVAAVSEWIVAAMIDLGRGISRYAEAYHRDLAARALHGPRAARLDARRDRLRPDRAPGRPRPRLRHARARRDAATDRRGDERVRQVALAELLAESDFVVCLAPANADTENLIDAAAFAAMKPGAFFVNAARGELVDDAALLAALDSGHLGGCGARRRPRARPDARRPALARHPRVIATPHIGGLTLPAIEHQAMETVAQLARLLRGEMPPGAVNAECV